MLLLAMAITGVPHVLAQSSIPPGAGDDLGPDRLRIPARPAYRAQPEAPLDLPPISPPPKNQLSSGIEVFVRKFKIIGNTVFPVKELASVTAPFENRVITAEELQQVRYRLTLLR
ncbi:MAG: hypothetical protein ACR2KU_03335 [Gammaproteobacteria bacterium]